jgi:hypothetical protein
MDDRRTSPIEICCGALGRLQPAPQAKNDDDWPLNVERSFNGLGLPEYGADLSARAFGA